jgi:uncharacterized membrane protein
MSQKCEPHPKLQQMARDFCWAFNTNLFASTLCGITQRNGLDRYRAFIAKREKVIAGCGIFNNLAESIWNVSLSIFQTKSTQEMTTQSMGLSVSNPVKVLANDNWAIKTFTTELLVRNRHWQG